MSRFNLKALGFLFVAIVTALSVVGVSAASQTAGTPAASPAASPSASPAASPAAGGASFQVATVDLAFQPNALTIPANTPVKIVVTNKGVLQHDFTIDELNVKTKLLNGGDSDTVTINAKPGTYQFYCSVPGHKEAGMVGTLTVK